MNFRLLISNICLLSFLQGSFGRSVHQRPRGLKGTKEPKPTKGPKPTKEPKPTKGPKPTKEPKPTKGPKPTKEPKAAKKKKDAKGSANCGDGMAAFNFMRPFSVKGDQYDLFTTAGKTGYWNDKETMGADFTYGPFETTDYTPVTSPTQCISKDECYIFEATDGSDSQLYPEEYRYSYPPSHVLYDGVTFFCTGPGPQGDHYSCTFGDACPAEDP